MGSKRSHTMVQLRQGKNTGKSATESYPREPRAKPESLRGPALRLQGSKALQALVFRVINRHTQRGNEKVRRARAHTDTCVHTHTQAYIHMCAHTCTSLHTHVILPSLVVESRNIYFIFLPTSLFKSRDG